MFASEKTILVVEDDPGLRTIVGEVLADEGYRVTLAGNGRDALRIIERGAPDLILLDMRLPVLDGWGFASELRRRQIDCPVIATTTAHDVRICAEQIGAGGYLPKPFTIDALIDVVDRFCPHPSNRSRIRPVDTSAPSSVAGQDAALS